MLGSFVLWAFLGSSDYYKQSIIGFGSLDTRSQFGETTDIASVANGQIVWKETATWTGGKKTITDLKLESSYEVEVEAARGNTGGLPFSTRYSVAVYSQGYAHKLSAYDITGIFSGNARVVTTEVTLDTVFAMDSRNGNATFEGKVINTRGQKHALTEKDTLAIGKFVINEELSITDPQELPEDPLAFCESLNRDVITDKTVPTGVYFAPIGYTVDENGMLIPEIPENTTT